MIEQQEIIKEAPYTIRPETIMQAGVQGSDWDTPIIIAAVEIMEPLSHGMLTVAEWINIAEAFALLTCRLADLQKALCDAQPANLAIGGGRLNVIDHERIAALPAYGRRREINAAVESLCKNALYPGLKVAIGCAALIQRMRDWWGNRIADEHFSGFCAIQLADLCRRCLTGGE